ncbi:BnaCnng59380D [Brassica napus]|uniref:BnaCnng59380D protein n=1 Tax=Brassica napus TaxID=3708 RepID=A0A078JP13_BRANA|nr:BnaCnng59380D [Brassica napus]
MDTCQMLVIFSYVVLTHMTLGNIDEFDCVDIYKQPAFQHPLLKHYKIPEKFTSNESFDRKNKYKTNDQSCPKGTVAILRQRSETESLHLDTVDQFGHHFAAMDAFADESIYRGAQADISIHNLTLQNNQYSKSQIWLENGPIAELNSIQVGWAVHPRMYGDSATRLTLYIGPEMAIRKLDAIIQNPVTFTPQVGFFGNWALTVDDEIIGYWPGELFTHLNKGASRVRFGGNTFISPDGISPPMGNGYFPIDDYSRCSSFFHVKLTSDKYQSIEAEPTIGIADSYCFNLIDRDYTNETGKSFSFGGPGGSCGV